MARVSRFRCLTILHKRLERFGRCVQGGCHETVTRTEKKKNERITQKDERDVPRIIYIYIYGTTTTKSRAHETSEYNLQ